MQSLTFRSHWHVTRPSTRTVATRATAETGHRATSGVPPEDVQAVPHAGTVDLYSPTLNKQEAIMILININDFYENIYALFKLRVSAHSALL